MDALTFLREQADNADNLLRRVFEPVTPEQAAWKLPGSTANTIGATFLHAYSTEDEAVHRLLGMPTVFESGGWKGRLGYDPDASWTLEGRPDTGLIAAYAGAVFEDTRRYLSGLAPDSLDQEVETPRGRRPLAARLGVYLVVHKFQHMGEIAALLGCQGVKGLPF